MRKLGKGATWATAACTVVVFCVILAFQYNMWISAEIDSYGRSQWQIASEAYTRNLRSQDWNRDLSVEACKAGVQRDYEAHTGLFTEPLNLRGTETPSEFLQRALALCDGGLISPPGYHPNWMLLYVQNHVTKSIVLLLADLVISALLSLFPAFLIITLGQRLHRA